MQGALGGSAATAGFEEGRRSRFKKTSIFSDSYVKILVRNALKFKMDHTNFHCNPSARLDVKAGEPK